MAERSVEIPPGGIFGDLAVPPNSRGTILFAHGTGSSRLSPRNRFVAGVLQETGFATLLLDLLTQAEEEIDLQTRHLRFDINLLAKRLISATEWLSRDPETKELALGYFGASTGAAAALVGAAELGETISAVVSRGGRPDLAGPALNQVKAPTLLIVGGNDYAVIDLNQNALRQLRATKRLEIVPNATHLFEEPGALEHVAKLTSDWFQQYLGERVQVRVANSHQ